MRAFKYHAVAEEDGRVSVSGVPVKKGQRVEMILLLDEAETERESQGTIELNAIRLKTKGFRFDREPANEQ